MFVVFGVFSLLSTESFHSMSNAAFTVDLNHIKYVPNDATAIIDILCSDRPKDATLELTFECVSTTYNTPNGESFHTVVVELPVNTTEATYEPSVNIQEYLGTDNVFLFDEQYRLKSGKVKGSDTDTVTIAANQKTFSFDRTYQQTVKNSFNEPEVTLIFEDYVSSADTVFVATFAPVDRTSTIPVKLKFTLKKDALITEKVDVTFAATGTDSVFALNCRYELVDVAKESAPTVPLAFDIEAKDIVKVEDPEFQLVIETINQDRAVLYLTRDFAGEAIGLNSINITHSAESKYTWEENTNGCPIGVFKCALLNVYMELKDTLIPFAEDDPDTPPALHFVIGAKYGLTFTTPITDWTHPDDFTVPNPASIFLRNAEAHLGRTTPGPDGNAERLSILIEGSGLVHPKEKEVATLTLKHEDPKFDLVMKSGVNKTVEFGFANTEHQLIVDWTQAKYKVPYNHSYALTVEIGSAKSNTITVHMSGSKTVSALIAALLAVLALIL
ncbi:hypothetical protein BLNAU_987 [Blattamonas nauphoetae]|uniref:Uncharacterized protein n=1 Tax=Blattamonas nauphoetae TaxID=2049346 RepID=A0ABQ9YJH3_9EUKA|nr:hypothetical protein BLNAU_987 [Blattamonas nauphoetae]